MTNIPTELLRTLVAVVELRSFTKAAHSLGVTQPAVSAQIKRLQTLLGSDLLDKSAPGVSLTPAGDLVVNYARRLLAINDQILDLAGPRIAAQTLRIGATGDFTAANIAQGLACYRARHPQQRFMVTNGFLEDLMRDLREAQLDVVVWVSGAGPTIDARHTWKEDLVWVRGPTTRIDDSGPVPLVSYGEECPFTAACLGALNAAGRDSELAVISSNIAGLGAAVAAGIGVTVLPRNSANIPGAAVWENPPLPRLPEVFCGIYVRPGSDSAARDHLADTIAQALRLRARVTGESVESTPAE